MSQSLSVILPVHNAENGLTQKVSELLEVISELTHELELLIVDNGSTDNTEEVAMELCRRYPQVSMFRQSGSANDFAAARAGIAKTSGDLVLIHDINSPFSGEAIRELWAMRNDEELVFARSEPPHQSRRPIIARTEAWSGTQMLRRDAVNDLQDNNASRTKIDRIMRTDIGNAAASNSNSILRQLTESPLEDL